ncbi:Glutamine amidotransferase class-I family protein, expressed [Zostera marina]|uniref:Glutamine amidotransferase class-I family protein, expressed n=1 Tax=Zostera marina TaxID=29655 RepID=A0A0K9PF78_ZOSMR|nr:Glutamine amidotransferase class-I family protein, expressed [Zostera marina]
MTISESEKATCLPEHQYRFAVLKLVAAIKIQYAERNYGCYGMMMVDRFKDGDYLRNEKWDVFSVLDGDFSFLDDHSVYDGFVITGSEADAHSEDVPWILRLCDALKFLHSQKKRLLGICFGHQILARALGGTTGRAPVSVGWEIGLKSIKIDTNAVADLYGLKDFKSDILVFEIHRDQVSSLPPGAVVLASSSKTEIEMFAIGDGVLGIQCHPEFSKDLMSDIIVHNLRSNDIITVDMADEAIRSIKEREPDQEAIIQLCKKILKG